ncbi:hypothetical protein B1L73_01295 [Salmonella enterica]|nr:hypothetical protein [Salmonella enterica]EAP6175090.1 hypothetical protein [Salmonella enterica]EAQ6300553.1 hypothetical protein [Salmonella enterica]EAQ6839638.1 hypothetical protein [Salmonella enterica]EBI4478663.1 hypothetical protein [Salmonella enterica]
MIIRLFWFLIPNHKFYEYALISKQCDILNVFLMFLFNPCLINKQRFSIRKNRITLATRDAASDLKNHFISNRYYKILTNRKRRVRFRYRRNARY